MGVRWKDKCFLSEISIHSAEVSKFAIISLSPGEDLPVHGQSHGMASPRMHGDLLHNIIAKCSDLAGDWNGPAGQTQAQPAISSLSTCIDLPLNCYCKNDKSRYLLLWLFLLFSFNYKINCGKKKKTPLITHLQKGFWNHQPLAQHWVQTAFRRKKEPWSVKQLK